MVTEIVLFESPDLTVLDFCLCGWMNSAVYKTNLEPPDELLASILDDKVHPYTGNEALYRH